MLAKMGIAIAKMLTLREAEPFAYRMRAVIVANPAEYSVEIAYPHNLEDGYEYRFSFSATPSDKPLKLSRYAGDFGKNHRVSPPRHDGGRKASSGLMSFNITTTITPSRATNITFTISI